MNVERLKHLVDLLRADAANPLGAKFDLRTWVGYDVEGENIGNYPVKPELVNENGTVKRDKVALLPADQVLEIVPTMSCDTYVCALGLAALDPEFNRAGLSFEVMPLTYSAKGWMIPQFNGAKGMAAGAAFFDITQADSLYFFDPENYNGAPTHAEGERFVADRIEAFIAGTIDHDHHPDYTCDDEDVEDD